MILHTDLRPVKPGLAPTGQPSALKGSAIGRILHVFRHGDSPGDISCFYKGPAGLTAVTPAGGSVTLSASCPTTTAFIDSGADEVTVMADGSTSVWRYTGSTWQRSDVAGTLSGPVVTASPVASLQHVLAARKLKGTYPTLTTPLTADDRATLTADITDAYRAMEAQAAAGGTFMQPVVARIRALDARERTVALTPPVLLLPSATTPLSALTVDRTVTIANGSFSDVAEASLKGIAFGVAVSWPSDPDAAWQNRVEEIIVEVSKPVDPLAKGALSLTRSVRRDASSATMTLAIPGAAVDGSAPSGVLRQVVDRLENIGIPAFEARLRRRSDGTWPSGRVMLSNATKGFRPAETADNIAGAVAVNGDIVMAADITRHHIEPESPALYAASTEGSAWGGSVKVTLNRLAANGKQASLVATFRGNGARPTSLSPLLVYPAGDATALRIAVGSSLAQVELTPTADGSMSYWLNPSLKPISLTEGSTALVPAENRPAAMRRPAMIAVSDAGRPLETLCRASLPEGVRVTSITAAARSRSSWDFGRAHFYLFTTAGIYAAAVNSARSRIDLSVIDSRDATAWAPTARGVIAAAGRSLLRLNGAAATEISSFDNAITAITALGCDNSRGEIWLAGADGCVTVTNADGAPLYRRRLKMTSAVPFREGFVASGPDGAFRVGDTELREKTAVVYDAIIGEALRRPPRQLMLWLTAAEADISIDLSGDGGDENVDSTTVAKFAVKGRLNAPLILPLIAPRRARWRLRISGLVSSDMLISKITLS